MNNCCLIILLLLFCGLNLPVADRNRNPAVAMIPGLNPGLNKDPLAGTDRPAAVREKETDCKN